MGKRQIGEDRSDNSSIANDSQSPPTKFRKTVNFPMKEVCLQELAMNIYALLEPALRKVVKEEVEPLMYFLKSHPHPRHSRVIPDSFSARSLQLVFVNKLPSILFTNSKVHDDEEHDPLHIQLIDSKSKSVIQHGPFSSVKVEIVVLSGDFAADGQEVWSENEFNANIVREREGKRPLLVGELSFSLVGGIGSMGNITFTDNSSWNRSRKFKLGVRVASGASLGGSNIREAITEAFVVLDHRGESYQKHHTPSLDDPIWRLKKISKQGASHKKLEAKGIKTVKDFLIAYNLNPSNLQLVLGKGVANKTWETMLKHANECHLDNTYYSYEADCAQLIFNCVYKVVGAKFVGQDYQPLNALDKRQKILVETMKLSAFSNPSQLVQVFNPFNVSTLMPLDSEQHAPCSSSRLDLQNDALSIIDQGEPDKHLDMNLSDSESYPCIIKDGGLLEGDSASQNNQQFPGISPDCFFMDDSPTAPSDGAYNWHQSSPIETYSQSSQFGEFSQFQTSQYLYPFTTNWVQGNDCSITSAAHGGMFSQFSGLDVNIPGTGKSKARWCKIRAAVIFRNVAARRKAKLPFNYF